MNSGNIEIRRAGAEDSAAVVAVVHAAYRHYIPRIGRRPAPMDADYTRLISDGAVWSAWVAGRVVGVCVLIAAEDHVLLDNIAVLPACQSGGIGGSLLRAAERHARDLGLPDLRLYTHELMTENIDFYRRHGFAETGRRTEHGFPRVYFRKPVHKPVNPGRADGQAADPPRRRRP